MMSLIRYTVFYARGQLPQVGDLWRHLVQGIHEHYLDEWMRNKSQTCWSSCIADSWYMYWTCTGNRIPELDAFALLNLLWWPALEFPSRNSYVGNISYTEAISRGCSRPKVICSFLFRDWQLKPICSVSLIGIVILTYLEVTYNLMHLGKFPSFRRRFCFKNVLVWCQHIAPAQRALLEILHVELSFVRTVQHSNENCV